MRPKAPFCVATVLPSPLVSARLGALIRHTVVHKFMHNAVHRRLRVNLLKTCWTCLIWSAGGPCGDGARDEAGTSLSQSTCAGFTRSSETTSVTATSVDRNVLVPTFHHLEWLIIRGAEWTLYSFVPHKHMRAKGEITVHLDKLCCWRKQRQRVACS